LVSALHLPSFSTNLVSRADLQDAWVDQFTPRGQHVTHCTCSRTGRHLATFTRRPESSLYTLITASPPVAAAGQVAASGQTLHMDVWGPARVRGQGHDHYFLLVIDNYSRYTTFFPLRNKGEVTEVLINWIRGTRRQLIESFSSDLLVLRLHSDGGGEFSSNLLMALCRAEGIRQTFTLLASPQQNGIVERRIGMVMDVARTSMIHAAAPHFRASARRSRFRPPHNKMGLLSAALAWSWMSLPRVSLPETTPTLRWTGKVGDVSVFHVWGSQAFVRDTSAEKLSSRAVDPVEPVEVAVDSGAARGAEPEGAGTGGVGSGVAVSEGAEPRGAEPERVEPVKE
ncbi:unnamed protein product, partial [Closterium sp. NIES-54]